MKTSFSTLVAIALAIASNAAAYWVQAPLSLEEIAQDADIILKGTCVSSSKIQDEWFKPVSGYESIETTFKVVSVIKGEKPGATLRFRHYDTGTSPDRMFFSENPPQSYHFEKGRTYLVFAKNGDVPGAFRQVLASQTGKEDQGAIECADAEEVKAGNIKEIVCTELQKCLQSDRPELLIYGIRQLDTMSNSQVEGESRNFDVYGTTKDFDRLKVLQAIVPLTMSNNEEIAQRAITAIGSRNPHMTENGIRSWLSSIEERDTFGNARMNAMKNPGGTLYQTELVAIADDRNRSGKTRATAIQALGLVRGATVKDHLEQWLNDSEPLVRSAASLLLADTPKTDLLSRAVKDQAAEVRINAAYAIGIARQTEFVETLDMMLKDPDTKVRRAASVSLLTFSPKNPAVDKVFKANIENQEFRPLFLVALAAQSVEPYLESIADVVEQKTDPKNWSGGTIPAFTAWKLLFKYLQTKPTKELQSGKWDRYLKALENGYITGSSEPTKIYAFYLQRGLKDRALNYREMMKKRRDDLDLYFDRVDADPKSESL